eukprot:m.134151 g.134151  ORF g.134151 m.134151 type:complete len:68 (+) comp38131_c1_seq13:515-718(+)
MEPQLNQLDLPVALKKAYTNGAQQPRITDLAYTKENYIEISYTCDQLDAVSSSDGDNMKLFEHASQH